MLKKTQIKLTIWYVLIIMFVSLSFSTFIYVNVQKNTKRALDFQNSRIESRIREFDELRGMGRMRNIPNFSQEALVEIRETLLFSLLYINIFILVASSLLGYFLAKKTLNPIEQMILKQKLFISSAAHELKTPLTAIKTNLQVTLRDKTLTLSKSKIFIKQTIEQVDNFNNFINNLLKQSKYQNTPNLVFKKHNVSTLLHSSLKSLEPIYKSKNIKINYLPKNFYIYANEEAIKEVFINIIENAIKYSKPDQKVSITHIKTNNFIVTKIKDSGIGINKKNLANIFDPFFRAEESREKNSVLGFGLGLSIANEIIKKHKGAIYITSKINKGTVVTVKIPKFYKS